MELMPIGTRVRTTPESGQEEVLHGEIIGHTNNKFLPYLVLFGGDTELCYCSEKEIEEDK